MRLSEEGARIPGDLCEEAPGIEASGQLLAEERCAQQMALEGKVLADGTLLRRVEK